MEIVHAGFGTHLAASVPWGGLFEVILCKLQFAREECCYSLPAGRYCVDGVFGYTVPIRTVVDR